MNRNLVRFCVPLALVFMAVMCLSIGWIQLSNHIHGANGFLTAAIILASAAALAFVAICIGGWIITQRKSQLPPMGMHGAARRLRGFPPGVIAEDEPSAGGDGDRPNS